MAEEKQSSRLGHLDLLRVFATYVVICIHTASRRWYSTPVDSMDWLSLTAYSTCFRFAVPVFFMISGVLFLNPEKTYTIKKIYTKYILRLFLAFVFWSTLYTAFIMLRGDYEYEFERAVYVMASGHYHMWFLFTLYGIYLMVPILRTIAKDKTTLQYFLVLSFMLVQGANLLMFHTTPAFWFTSWQERAHIYLVSGYTGYFLLGYYLHAYPPGKLTRLAIYYFATLSVTATFVATWQISLKNNWVYEDLFGYLLPNTYLLSAAVFLAFQHCPFPKKLLDLADFLNPYCFGIYLIHDFMLMIFLERGNLFDLPIPWVVALPLYSFGAFFMSLCTIAILYQIPIFRKTIL